MNFIKKIKNETSNKNKNLLGFDMSFIYPTLLKMKP